jgi:hypothetical protein
VGRGRDDSGRLVEGVLHSYTLTQDDAENRDIALKAPIRVTLKNEQASPTLMPATRVIIPGMQIVAITVVHADVAGNRVEESLVRQSRLLSLGSNRVRIVILFS